jgi:hypothetical protein
LVSIRLIDESAHAQSSIKKSALFYDLCFTFSHNLGRWPPDAPPPAKLPVADDRALFDLAKL